VLEARVELPSNVSLAGAVGAKCLGVLRGWTRPAEIRRTISHGSLIDAFTHTASDRVHSWAESLAMGEVFSLDAAPILVILSQLHPGARHARYDPLDPGVRAGNSAAGVVAELTTHHLVFEYRIHAEFQLSESPALFFMPGQLRARMRTSPDLTRVLSFRLWLPDDRVYNALLECGMPFASLGDREGEAESPDDRRWSSERLILRASRGDEGRDEAHNEGHEEGRAEGHDAGHDEGHEETLQHSADPSGVDREDDPSLEEGGQESCHPPVSEDESSAARGTGETRAVREEGESEDVSVVMGQILVHPGQGLGTEGENAQEDAEEDESLDTAVQEIKIVTLDIKLVPDGGGTMQGTVLPLPSAGVGEFEVELEGTGWVEDKLAISLMPFLDAGYRADYFSAFEEAQAQGKPLVAVVLWGALDDASC